MNLDSTFHLAFVILFLAMLAIRGYYRIKSVRARGQVAHHEGVLNTAIRGLFGASYIGGVVVYLFNPTWLTQFAFSLPAWVRWVGIVISLISLSLLLWVHASLNIYFDTTLHIQENHQIITIGPYRWVRHPMYTTLFLLGVGFLFASANWAIGIPYLTGLIVVLIYRVPKEEALLAETFGHEYNRYKQATGKYFPKFSSLETRKIQEDDLGGE